MAAFEGQRGIRKISAAVADGGAATPTLLYQVTTMGVTRSCILRKVIGYNLCAANSVLQIGTGLAAAWAVVYPPFLTLNGLNFGWLEDELPGVEFFQDITFQVNVTGVTLMVEVEEIE